MCHLRLSPEQHPTSKELTLTGAEADALRIEHVRVRALHRPSMKLLATARSR